MTGQPPALAPDLADGLRRLKLAAMRRLAPELLRTAKTNGGHPKTRCRVPEFTMTPARTAVGTATMEAETGPSEHYQTPDQRRRLH
ncbi:MAG: hypothetical protein ACRDSR_25780 [Pseudonocardiaceae bacterium]